MQTYVIGACIVALVFFVMIVMLAAAEWLFDRLESMARWVERVRRSRVS
jgi:hypothetical protein